MLLKNSQIVALAAIPIVAASTHSLGASEAFKVFKFKKEIARAFEAYSQSERDLLSEAGITSPNSFDSDLAALRTSESRTPEDEARLTEMEASLATYLNLRSALLNEAVELNITPLSYDMWFKLQSENSAKEYNGTTVDIFSGNAEILLENILWEAPEE